MAEVGGAILERGKLLSLVGLHPRRGIVLRGAKAMTVAARGALQLPAVDCRQRAGINSTVS